MRDYGNQLHKMLVAKLAAVITADPQEADLYRSMDASTLEGEYFLTFNTHLTQETLRGLKRRGEALPKGALLLP